MRAAELPSSLFFHLLQLASDSRSKLRAASKMRMGDGDAEDAEQWLQAKDPVKPADQVRSRSIYTFLPLRPTLSLLAVGIDGGRTEKRVHTHSARREPAGPG